jgi:DNA polymerase III subunit delta'
MSAPTTAPAMERVPGWPVWGNTAAVSALRHALAAGALGHAYLITGPPGVGRETLAMALAMAVNCERVTPGVTSETETAPCGVCRSCRHIARGIHPDVRVISLATQAAEAERKGTRNASITIDTIRDLKDEAYQRPNEGRKRVYLIAQAEALNDASVSALLKVLEEPPAHVLFLLVAPSADAVLPTIRSRCQPVAMHALPRAVVADWLVAEHGAEAETAARVAALAGGRPGAALTLLAEPERAAGQTEGVETFLAMMETGGIAPFRAIDALEKRWKNGGEERAAVMMELDTWLGCWRDALLIAVGQRALVTHRAQMARLEKFAAWPLPALHTALAAVEEAVVRLDRNVNPRLALEAMVVSWQR